MIRIPAIRRKWSAPAILGLAIFASMNLALLVLLAAPILDSLFAKTFAILGSQLAVTWVFTFAVIQYIRQLYAEGAIGVFAAEAGEGEPDLEIDWSLLRPYFWLGLVLNFGLFIVLLTAGRENLLIGIPAFTLWSMLTGIEIALALISVDENLGARVLGMAAALTAVAALVGIYVRLPFTALRMALFLALLVLLLGLAMRLFVSISRWKQRMLSLFGVTVFLMYLLLDFGRLAQQGEQHAANSWPVAMDIAVGIYLDVVNLVMFLLDLLSD